VDDDTIRSVRETYSICLRFDSPTLSNRGMLIFGASGGSSFLQFSHMQKLE
jgi:hypothetical protein